MQALRTRLDGLGFPPDVALRRMTAEGLAHDHFELAGTSLLVRVPVQSQLGLDPATHLRYEATCFERAAASGHTPRLHAVLEPAADLPMGGLLVDAIDGRPPRLPGDLPLLAQSLAALHSLEPPARSHRPPLRDPTDPVADTFSEVEERSSYLTADNVDRRSLRMIAATMDGIRELLAGTERPPVRLISFDTHPGNFVIDRQERAVLVDLEKARYGAPSLDLAHATLYTSTTWDTRTSAVLEPSDIDAFYEAWSGAVEPAVAAGAERWHAPMRRLMWLWSVTWSARWRAENGGPGAEATGAADRDGRAGGSRLIEHVRGRVDDYLDPETIARIQEAWQDRP